MSGLSDLLQRLNTEGWSSRRIEKEAARHGHQLSNATAARYLRGTHPDRPSAETLQAFADLFAVDVAKLRSAAGLAGGGGTPFELGADAARLTGPQRDAIRTTVRLFLEANDALARQAVPDGATTSSDDTSPHVPDAGDVVKDLDRQHADDRPWEQDEYSLAAKRGRNRGREARQQQDREAEGGGA